MEVFGNLDPQIAALACHFVRADGDCAMVMGGLYLDPRVDSNGVTEYKVCLQARYFPEIGEIIRHKGRLVFQPVDERFLDLIDAIQYLLTEEVKRAERRKQSDHLGVMDHIQRVNRSFKNIKMDD